MPNPVVHGGVNTLVYIALAFILSFHLMVMDWWWMVLFGLVFDFDHVPYFLLNTRPLTIQNLKTSGRTDYVNKVPHFYPCHTLEFQVLLVCMYIGTGGATWSLGALAGWGIHLVTDVASYLRQYHSFNPWAKYWSIGYYFLKGKREQSVQLYR